jgi:hypothetical protein
MQREREVRDKGFNAWKSTSAGREMSASDEDDIIGNAAVAIAFRDKTNFWKNIKFYRRDHRLRKFG